MAVIAVLILLLGFHEVIAVEQANNENCIKTYQELERAVIQRQSNMDSMVSAFFPPNRQASIAANVYYFFDDQNMSMNAENLDITSYDYAFRWSASPIFNLIRPELLHHLSLYVYCGDTTTIKIVAVYEQVTGPLVRSVALKTEGAAGPSGINAQGWRWRRLCSSI